jgi:S-disulfanyl-L-cysteine oxidoreductase SoxD
MKTAPFGMCMRSALALLSLSIAAATMAGCGLAPPAQTAIDTVNNTANDTAVATAIDGQPIAPALGQPLSPGVSAGLIANVFPDGRGLPAGRGSAAEGAPLFKAHCAACHGEGGRGATAEELAGGHEPLTSASPDKTIGLYWPYATTVFDVVRRGMPMNAPGSLSNDEVYAITAYLLHVNGLIGEHDVIDRDVLPRVRMPNRAGFVGVDAALPAAPASAR